MIGLQSPYERCGAPEGCAACPPPTLRAALLMTSCRPAFPPRIAAAIWPKPSRTAYRHILDPDAIEVEPRRSRASQEREQPMSIDLAVEDGVAVVTINRPERKNAVTLAMREEITRIFERAQDDNAIRALVLTGAGPDFS